MSFLMNPVISPQKLRREGWLAVIPTLHMKKVRRKKAGLVNREAWVLVGASGSRAGVCNHAALLLLLFFKGGGVGWFPGTLKIF